MPEASQDFCGSISAYFVDTHIFSIAPWRIYYDFARFYRYGLASSVCVCAFHCFGFLCAFCVLSNGKTKSRVALVPQLLNCTPPGCQ